MEKDRTEMHDLAGDNPDRVEEMANAYEVWAERCGVIPRSTILELMRTQGKAFWEKDEPENGESSNHEDN
jgi:arylsulfatase